MGDSIQCGVAEHAHIQVGVAEPVHSVLKQQIQDYRNYNRTRLVEKLFIYIKLSLRMRLTFAVCTLPRTTSALSISGSLPTI